MAEPKEWEAFGGKTGFNCLQVQSEGVECIYLTWISAYSSFLFIMYVSPASLCENVRKTVAKSPGAV